jgi:alkaline phosphatase
MSGKKITRIVPFGFMALLLVACATPRQAIRPAQEARHIILLIGDGMNLEHEIAASRYLYGSDFALAFHKLPYQCEVATWDVTTYNAWAAKLGKPPYDPKAIEPILGYDPAKGGKRPYPLDPEPQDAQAYHTFKATDSASAATAWATGHKTDDGNIAWQPGDPEDGALKTVAELLREKKGYAVGVVSTVPFSHATPAAHVSHNRSRKNFKEIGAEILTRTKPEVLIGGGHPGLGDAPDYTYISRNDYEDFKKGVYSAEYVFVERISGHDGGVDVLQAAQKAAEGKKKLFGLFGIKSAGNFESLQPQDLPGTPLVTQNTRENPTFAEAALAALKVLSQDPDGFFLMAEQGDIDWANHANDFKRMVGTIKDLQDGAQAIIDFVNQPGDALEWTNTLLIVTADHGNSYMRNKIKLCAGDLPRQNSTGNRGYAGPACTYPNGEVTYATTGHTNELVRLYALGAGTEELKKYEGQWYPGTHILDNTQMFYGMMAAAGTPVPSPCVTTQAIKLKTEY